MKSKRWAIIVSLLFSAAPFAAAQDTPEPPSAPPQPAPSAAPFAAPRPAQAPALPRPPIAGGAFGGGMAISPATGLPAPPAPGSFTERLRNIIRRADGGSGGGAEPLVIRFSSMEPKAQAQLEQDLAIMSHILVKNASEVGRPQPYTAMGISVANPGGGGQPPAVYLEGYGAVFMLEVGFPLMPPPTGAPTQKVESRPNSDWEQAKQEMFGPGPNGGPSTVVGVDPTTGLPLPPGNPYSRQQVEHLRDGLLRSLKDAANIRGMKPQDWVAVTAFNPRSQQPMPVRPVYLTPSRRTPDFGQESAKPRGTVLALRTKFSAVEDLAKGKVSLDDFSKQVEVQTYAVASPDGMGGSYGGYGTGGRF